MSKGSARRRRRIAAPLVVLGAVFVLGLAASSAGAGNGVAGLRPLSGEMLNLRGARDLGPLSRSQQITVAITVKHNLGALYRAEWALYRPGSPSYHHFLTPAQFRSRYGTPPSVVAAVRRFGTAHGLRLFHPGTLYDYVELYGTVRQVESTFGVRIDHFTEPGTGSFYANVNRPLVPARLPIDAVLGLENLSRFHTADLHGTSTVASAKTIDLTAAQRQSLLSAPFGAPRTPKARLAKGTPAQQGNCQTDPTGSQTLCTGLLSPQEFWNAYQAPGAGMSGPDSSQDFGQGQSIGIIGEGQTLDVITALREFEKTRGLPQVPVQVYHTDVTALGAENTLDDSGRVEWEMDSQASTGMAPEVSQLRMYFGSSLALTELTGALGTWVNDPSGPLQTSASLGACEDNAANDPLFGADQRADQAFLIQAAAEGRTFFASAGDTGAGCSVAVSENGIQYGPIPGPEYPSIDPNTVSVGGTILYTGASGQNVLERAWDHTGGAPSKWLPQPPWQAGASPELQTNACPGVYGNGQSFGSNLCRAGNDVAAESGDITISVDHKLGDVTSGYDPRTAPVQANGIDMVDFCPASEAASENTPPNEGPVSPACVYDANGGSAGTYTTDGTAEPGVMTDHFSEGGTSLSSPLWLGMWALVQAHHDAGNASASSLGLASPLIYKLAQGPATSHDFTDITLGANPLPAHPGWDFPTGWGSPVLKYLIADASGTPGNTAPQVTTPTGGNDPAAVQAQAPSGPSCSYAFYDAKSDSPDGFTGQQDDQLDLVQGTFGLTSDGSKLRVVLNIKNLSKTIPTGSNYLDYEFFWTNPSGDTGPDAVDVQVDSSGNVNYADGTESVTSAGGSNNYQFNPASTNTATGTFGSGPNGAIEVDVPLSALGLKAGDVLTGPSAYTADGINGVVTGLGFIADQDGPGNNYRLGDPTCLDSSSSTSTTTTSTTTSSTTSSSTTSSTTSTSSSTTSTTSSSTTLTSTTTSTTSTTTSSTSTANTTSASGSRTKSGGGGSGGGSGPGSSSAGSGSQTGSSSPGNSEAGATAGTIGSTPATTPAGNAQPKSHRAVEQHRRHRKHKHRHKHHRKTRRR